MSTRELPTCEPSEIAAGESPRWTRGLRDFSPADGWALTYYFRGPGAGFDVVAATDPSDGDRFLVEVASNATSALSSGTYCWQAWVSNGAEKYLVGENQVRVVTGFAGTNAATPVDNRTPAQKILDAIDAMLAGKATKDQMEYQIGTGDSTRMLRTFPPTEWARLRDTYARIVARERRRGRVRRGGTLFSSVKVRFDRPR